MASEWYFQIMGEEAGPFSESKIRELLDTGKIAPDAWIRKGKEGKWESVEVTQRLFESTPCESATNEGASKTSDLQPPSPTESGFPIVTGIENTGVMPEVNTSYSHAVSAPSKHFKHPISDVCPNCGSSKYRKAKAKGSLGFSRRACEMCHTQYQTTNVVRIQAVLSISFGSIISLIGLIIAGALKAGLLGAFVVGAMFVGPGGTMLVFGIRALGMLSQNKKN